jgi:hypothetical protein
MAKVYGEVESVDLWMDRAVIRYKNSEQAAAALKGLQDILKGEKITVRYDSKGSAILLVILVLATLLYYFVLRNLLFKR